MTAILMNLVVFSKVEAGLPAFRTPLQALKKEKVAHSDQKFILTHFFIYIKGYMRSKQGRKNNQ
jgi:hypothetical protein